MTRARKLGTISIILGLAAAAAIYGLYRRDISRARERVAAAGSRVIETRCGRIEYAEAGSGPPVLVVHGAGGGFDQGMDFGEPLAAKGFRVIAVSRFGYLRTPLPADASAEAQADAHACLLDALGIERAAVIGASAGAPSTLQFALRHPRRCRAMVLMVPAVYVPRTGEAASVHSSSETQFMVDTALRFDFIFWAAMRVARASVMRSLLATPPEVVERASNDEQARVARVMDHILPVSPRRLGLLNDGAIVSSIRRYELEKITTPTLAISAADDLFGTYDSAKYTAGQIPKARFIGYPSGGHLVVGHQQEVIEEISAFLKLSPDL